jgi:hypothetical protein
MIFSKSSSERERERERYEIDVRDLGLLNAGAHFYLSEQEK